MKRRKRCIRCEELYEPHCGDYDKYMCEDCADKVAGKLDVPV